MGMSINSVFGLNPNSGDWGVNTNSKQFKAAWNDIKGDLAEKSSQKRYRLITKEGYVTMGICLAVMGMLLIM